MLHPWYQVDPGATRQEMRALFEDSIGGEGVGLDAQNSLRSFLERLRDDSLKGQIVFVVEE